MNTPETATATPSNFSALKAAMEASLVPKPAEKTPTAQEWNEAMKAVREQPGRPSKDAMIRQLMQGKGMTRAQAKVEIRKFDEFMAKEFIKQKDQYELSQSCSLGRVKPLTAAIFLG